MAAVAWQAVACILLADFITGVAHFVERTYLTLESPLGLGRYVARPNIDHHLRPWAIVEHGFWQRNWQMCLIGYTGLAAAYFAGFFSWQLALVVAWASCGNEWHSYAHGNPPAWAKLLQDCGLLITPKNHHRHHRSLDVYFCVSLNCLNPLLEAIHFWRAVEWMLSCLGVHPQRNTKEREYV